MNKVNMPISVNREIIFVINKKPLRKKKVFGIFSSFSLHARRFYFLCYTLALNLGTNYTKITERRK
jgi:hypothetical protein